MKPEISHNLDQLVEEAGQVGIDPEEMRVRFLYKNGFLLDLTVKEFAILASLHPQTVWCHRKEWGFRKVAGVLRTNIANYRSAISGKTSQGDPRSKT